MQVAAKLNVMLFILQQRDGILYPILVFELNSHFLMTVTSSGVAKCHFATLAWQLEHVVRSKKDSN